MRQPILVAAVLFATAPAVAAAVDGKCATNKVILSPAEMLNREDSFRASLGDADRAALNATLPRAPDGRIAQCAGRDGAACDAAAYTAAFRTTGLMPRFLATICPKP